MKGGIRAERQESRLAFVSAAVAAWIAGMLLQFHPMLLSGMQRIEGTRSDSRLVNYMLEHGYRWILGMPGHEHFWTPVLFLCPRPRRTRRAIELRSLNPEFATFSIPREDALIVRTVVMRWCGHDA